MNPKIIILAFLFLSACGAKTFSTSDNGNFVQQSVSDDPDSPDNTNTSGPPIDILINEPEQVENYSCGKNKVLICHVPPGNPSAARTLCIGHCAVESHIREHSRDPMHADTLGECPNID
jgi:hypothetical protein